MSKNCIRCVANRRTGADLLCDACRAAKRVVTFPPELLEQFQKTSFCPHDAFPGSPETGWNTLRVDYDKGGESDYPSTAMFYDYHCTDGVKKATRPFADWPGSRDGQFVKAVIDWLQTMTPATRAEAET